MESTFEVISANSPSKTTQPKKSPLSVLSSIENKGENLERKFINNVKTDATKLQNIRPHTSDNISKRYCVSQDIKDNFYAIHHIQNSNKENEFQDAENIDPSKTSPTSRKLNNKGRKRVLTDKATIFTPLITDPVKRKKARQPSKLKKEHPPTSLYQTCQKIWPEFNTLGDLSHDRIKSLSDLLKIRLNQAKFKMMAKMDKENDLFSYLAEEYVPPKPKPPCAVALKKQKSQSPMIVVGNGKNLFARQHNKPQRRHSVSMSSIMESIFDSPVSPTEDKSPQRKTPSKDRKKKLPKTNILKTKRATTPKRRSAAADVIPVVLSDGSSVYVCEPCNKKYKNRNGLAYHMERCKNKAPDTNDEKDSSQPHSIDCICSQTSDENRTMIQCDKCHQWSHSDCVGVLDDLLEETFYCSKCKFDSQVEQDLLQCLLEAQATEPQYQLPGFSKEQQDQLNQLKELLNQPSIQEQDHPSEEDELLSMPTTTADDDSSQLHVWDDFNVNSTFDKTNQEQWTFIDDEEPFSSYDTDLQSSTWNMSDLNMFTQPPSLLFTENTMDSALDEDSLPLIGDLATPMTISESTPCDPIGTPAALSSTSAGTPHNWFQFANFDNDYCENDASS